MTHPQLRDQDVEDLRRAEARHARRIKEKRKAREYMRWLEGQRESVEDRDDH